MKTSVIRQRVADFLRRHAPFDSLEEQDLLELAGSGKVKFHESDEYVYWQGDAKGAFVWMIQQGRVELLEQSGGQERLEILSDAEGVWRCRTTFNCTEACPRGIQLTEAIIEVQRALLTGSTDEGPQMPDT